MPLNYLNNNYDPETGQYIDAAPISTAIDNALMTRSLDRNGLMCNNTIELAGNPYTIDTATELTPDPNYPTATNDSKSRWRTFWSGFGMLFAAITSIVIAAGTFGAGIPISMQILAGATIGVASLVAVNGASTMIEAGFGYNFMRDGLFEEVMGLEERDYYIYEIITETIMTVGTMALGIYHMTGQYKAAKYGQKFLGKGYKKVKGDKLRWVSKDGLRQMIFDDTHHFIDGVVSKNHFNLNVHLTDMRLGHSKIVKKYHLFYSLFKIWIK